MWWIRETIRGRKQGIQKGYHLRRCVQSRISGSWVNLSLNRCISNTSAQPSSAVIGEVEFLKRASLVVVLLGCFGSGGVDWVGCVNGPPLSSGGLFCLVEPLARLSAATFWSVLRCFSRSCPTGSFGAKRCYLGALNRGRFHRGFFCGLVTSQHW